MFAFATGSLLLLTRTMLRVLFGIKLGTTGVKTVGRRMQCEKHKSHQTDPRNVTVFDAKASRKTFDTATAGTDQSSIW